MNLEKVEFHGFKSFADKVSLSFSNGVTAIIGPNGCGKSNISDAIRWTLGEQSSKQLRGKSMQDVIFNGTQSRKSMSFCKVSIYFNNESQRIFPKLSYDQVIITRELTRDGNSKYYLNNNLVRLKDIVNLLHDTGIGKEGYSIIAQGRVHDIVDAKPENRRQIFEEAAGISKFRAEKNEAERKLETTSQNLAMQNEIIAEIEKQLNPLKKQAEAAKIYFEYKEQLKSEEINTYIYMYENNKSMKERIKFRLDKLIKDIDDNISKFNAINKESEELFAENSNLDRQLNAYNTEYTTLRVDAANIAGDIKLFQEKISNLQSEITRLEQEIKDINYSLHENSTLNDEKQKELEEAKGKHLVVQKEFDEHNNILSVLTTSIEGKESDLENSNMAYVSSLEELGALKNNLVNYESELARDNERLSTLNNLVNEQQAELTSIETDLSIAQTNLEKEMNSNNELLSQRIEATEDKENAEESLKEIDKNLNTLTGNLTGLQSKLDFQTSIKNEYSGYQDSIKNLMNYAKADITVSEKILGILAEVIEVPKEYVSAIEYSLGNALQTVLVKNTTDANELIAYLKQKNLGRITFRPLTSCREKFLLGQDRQALNETGVIGLASDLVNCKDMFRPFVNSFLGTTVVVDTGYTAATLQKKYNFNFKIVTLDGDIYAKSGDITGGSRRSSNSGLLAQDNIIEEINQSLERTKKNIDTMRKLRDSKFEEVNSLTKDIDKYNEEISSCTINIRLYSEKVSEYKTRKENIEPKYQDNLKLIDSLNVSIESLKNNIEKINQLQKDVDKNKEKYNALFAQSKEQSGEQKSEREILTQKVMDLRVKVAEAYANIESINADLFHIDTEKNRLLDEKREAEAQLEQCLTTLSLVNSSEKKNINSEDQKRIDELELLINNISNRRQDINDKLSFNDSQKNILLNEKGELTEKKVREESLLQRCDEEMIEMQQNILEEYGLTYGTCQEFRKEDYEYNGCKTRMQDIKRNIAKLGDVNPLAIETLKETEERYNQNVVQRDDIQKAYNDIQEIISELTVEMRTKFLDAFNKINENFKTIFIQLFGGGKGELRLNMTQTDDVLEAGIDILATPDGKRIANLSQLSGGEQSLTAIGILFAIISLNPMPFCILDEIDAPLDDTNANLFAQFLKKYATNTQFIVITHKKPTMVQADTLFGVTMEEKGVTKFVSVELESVEKFGAVEQ